MTMPKTAEDMSKTMAWVLSVLGALLIVGGLGWLIIARTMPPGIDEERATERRQNLAEMRGADQAALSSAGVVDAEKGVYRIPIDAAMNLMLGKWEDPAAGRADLLARIEEATAEPPPEENPYE